MGRLFLIILITFLLAILEVGFFPYPLLFLWVVCYSLTNPPRASFYLAFLSGIFSDFLQGEMLGKTALLFLGFSLLISLYKKKFKVLHPLYFFPFILGAVGFFEVWEMGRVFWPISGFWLKRVFLSLLVAIVLFKLAQRFKPKEEIKL